MIESVSFTSVANSYMKEKQLKKISCATRLEPTTIYFVSKHSNT